MTLSEAFLIMQHINAADFGPAKTFLAGYLFYKS